MDLEFLKTAFECQAEWRDGKAAEYPDDERNLEAVKIFKRLLATVDEIPQDLLTAGAAASERDIACEANVWDEYVRSVGFHTEPADAADFVRGYIDEVGRDRRAREQPPTLKVIP